jgi:hypothetical protein
MQLETEYLVMDSCPITGFKLVSNGQLARESERGKPLSSDNRAMYYREWNQKNRERIKEKNRQKYLESKKSKAS